VTPRVRMRILACRYFVAVGAALSFAAFAGRSPASADELVKFVSAAPRTQAAQQRDGAAPASRKQEIRGYLTKPKGDGPFPAVALLHSCLGLPADRRAIADALASWGYVALFVDDFATRGIKETCAVDFSAGIADSFGALLYLSKLPYVDARRIGAIGYSQGADTALTIASSRLAVAFAIPDDLRFRAAAAFYPPCENQAGVRLTIPTEILIGAADEVTPAADCEKLAKAQPAGGSDLKLIVYPGAAHLFDDPRFAEAKSLLGMRLKYDRGAAEQSRSDLREFLAGKLAR
jgi:dienelactone hydrolase